MAVNKVVVNEQTIMDLTDDTVIASKLLRASQPTIKPEKRSLALLKYLQSTAVQEIQAQLLARLVTSI
nr:MAG TPA: hypothetical protein [Caudoviricetes sp.]